MQTYRLINASLHHKFGVCFRNAADPGKVQRTQQRSSRLFGVIPEQK